MSRSQQTFGKKEREKKKRQKKKEKEAKREERKANSTSGDLENMLAYLDENGNIVSEPPDPDKKKKEIPLSSIEISTPPKEETDEELRGKVVFFNDDKGYGFIDQDQTKQRFFVHVKGAKQPITEGDRVKFKSEKTPKGMSAIEVEKL
jgi:cold shock CspA family protein